MGLSTETIETWECDSCGAHVRKPQVDMLRRPFPPAGWCFVESDPGTVSGVACGADCYRCLLIRWVDKRVERAYRFVKEESDESVPN